MSFTFCVDTIYHQLHCSSWIVVVLFEREKGVDIVAPLKKVPWSSRILKKIFFLVGWQMKI